MRAKLWICLIWFKIFFSGITWAKVYMFNFQTPPAHPQDIHKHIKAIPFIVFMVAGKISKHVIVFNNYKIWPLLQIDFIIPQTPTWNKIPPFFPFEHNLVFYEEVPYESKSAVRWQTVMADQGK